MRAGKLNRVVTVESQTATVNNYNQPLDTWTTFATVYASIEPISGREFITQSGQAAQVSHRITLRYLAGLTPKHRIKYGSRVFDIQFIANTEERNREMILQCSERVL